MKRREPPVFARGILRLSLHQVDTDAVMGDLEESFRYRVEKQGLRSAQLWYWSQVLRSAPRLVISSIQWSCIMVWSYVRLTIRNLRRHKGQASINILGLAIGLASCLLILRYVTDELSYDRFHEKADQIYRMNWDFNWNESEGIGSGTPPPLAARLEADFPEIETATRVYPLSPTVARFNDRFFVEEEIRGVDANFLEVFSFDLIEGDAATALDSPGKVVLTEESARRYFGDAKVVGETISIGESGDFLGRPYNETFTVTGIIADPPHSSHIEFDMLTSISSHPQVAFFDWSWMWMQVVTYVTVTPGTSIPDLEAKLVGMVATHASEAFNRAGFSFDELIATGGRWNFVFQPLSDIYLNSADIGNRLGPIGNRTYLSIFSVIAAFILLIACINFMNLSTARSVTRAREIGVRKVLGSVRRGLIGQFMTEAMLYAALAMLIAIGLMTALLGPFGDLTGKEFQSNLAEPGWLPLALLLLTIIVGILAGSYPSIYLSSFKPIEVLRTKFGPTSGSLGLRNGLVVFQFAISIALICCTLIVQNQIRFFGQADLGFNKEGVLVISNQNHRLGDQALTYKERLERHSDVLAASISTGVPPYYGFQDYYKIEGRGDDQLDLISYQVDADFEEALGIEIIAGRGFSEDFGANATSVVLNESAVTSFGWEEPVGKTIWYPGSGTFTVIGVMRDFNFLSMNQPIAPFALFHESSQSYTIDDSYVVVRVQPQRLEETIRMLESEWATVAPAAPFEYSFLDENFDAQYRAEHRLGSLFTLFAGLAIFIACLGLLGLAAFTVERRTKEIGIRKAFGASTARVIYLLSKDFSKWVLVANLIAWPIAWYGMNRWLDSFAYRIDMGYSAFLAAGIAALVVALATVGYHALRSATANPIEALRYE